LTVTATWLRHSPWADRAFLRPKQSSGAAQAKLAICDHTIDVTYLWTAEGWLYVAVVLDVCARKVVGWAMREPSDAALGQQVLRMALGRQPPVGLVHHLDRGSQYAWTASQQLLAQSGICGSMSRKGDCLDNAVVERFFGSLKREWTGHCQYATRHEAKSDVIAYSEMFYNSSRKPLISGLYQPQ
jgi:putative transposase